MKMFKRNSKSKEQAKDRLKLVLIQDRANISPQFLEMVKSEITNVVKNYLEIEEGFLDIQIVKVKKDNGKKVVPSLVANIPIKNVRSNLKISNF